MNVATNVEISIKNLIEQIKKQAFVKVKFENGSEKKTIDFEPDTVVMIDKFIKALIGYKDPQIPRQQDSSAPVMQQQSQQLELPQKKIESEKTVAVESPSVKEEPKEESVIDAVALALAKAKMKEVIAEKSDEQKSESVVKTAKKENGVAAPGFESVSTTELKNFLVANKIPLVKTLEWYALVFSSYGIPEWMYKGQEKPGKLNELYRRWIGDIDSNQNYIQWQFTWLVSNFKNNAKNIFENTFCVDKARLTDTFKQDLEKGPVAVLDLPKAKREHPAKQDTSNVTVTPEKSDVSEEVSVSAEVEEDEDLIQKKRPPTRSVNFE